ncbi:MAG TPA: thioredoxin-like domain-containing protein [Chthoniobacterales bacterium]
MSHKTLCLLGSFLILLDFTPLAEAQGLTSELEGRLVSLQGKSLLPYNSADLAQAKYIALYFSAGWCGPCHQFTPELLKFYNEMKPQRAGFEIVFMSEDYGANAMEKYMAEMAMPWPAMRYSAAKSSRLKKYAGRGIPDLVLLNEKGEVISDSYASQQYLGPYKVMNDLKKLLTGDPSGVAQAALATPAPLAPAQTEPARPAIKSPSGTNWDEVFKKKSP